MESTDRVATDDRQETVKRVSSSSPQRSALTTESETMAWMGGVLDIARAAAPFEIKVSVSSLVFS